jgi:DNA-directed RNA polymerase specialized sigma24 family protein|tara:strand:+ start:1386 stop:1565 length:180 start_codon:yes stop_codon:yes gene_type:complete
MKDLNKLKKKPRSYEPWEEDEDNKLKSLYLENISIDEIAQILKRQPNAIRSRLRKQELN